ncbi:MAG TPA: hypothetical protein VL181_04345 [Holophagaceae bacterium]|nr:hypothetical protein [Holophagaceae bacterium]
MTTAENATAEWSFAKRLGFRFLFSYFVLYFFPLPSGLADPDWLSGILDKPWHKVATWAAGHLFRIQLTTFSNGSGDTTYDYVRVFCMAVIAGVAALMWTALSRRREERTLHGWARVWLRYALAASMLTYGLAKVIKLQFPAPGFTRLTETYGDSTPMGLLWTFMGFSTGYTFFAGAGEVLGGLLLFFRRTTMLGALVVIGVMSNVVMLNYCYDVPVKLGSTHLLVLALFLLAPDLRRLADFLLFNRATQPADLGPDLQRTWARRGAMALKAAVILGFLVPEVSGALKAYARYGHPSKLVPPDGFYLVDSFNEDGKDVPPSADDAHRWKKFVLLQGYVRTWNMNGSTELFKVQGDPMQGPISLLPVEDNSGEVVPNAPPVGQVTLKAPVPGQSGVVSGVFKAKQLQVAISVENRDTSKFNLMSRGFHWISEFPYNR